MRITVRHVAIPMRYAFGHARAKRQLAENVIVEVTLDGGARGHGECVPRSYVTGETIESVKAAIVERATSAVEVRDGDSFASLCGWLAETDLARRLSSGSPTLAAAAGLELALLDAYARREGRAVLDGPACVPRFAPLLVQSPSRTVRQTLTIGDDVDGALDRAGAITGPVDLKLKIGFGREEDRARAARLRERFGAAIDLRGDANAAWDGETARATLLGDQALSLSSVEEPLAGRDLAGCAELRRAGVKIMLDESLCSLEDAERAIEAGAADLFNLRLSKCGGLFGTLRLVERAARAGIAWQLGCMVGETGILSSLGRGFVARVRGARYFESTVPTKSLEEDITDARLEHLAGTRETPVPQGIGFGGAIRPDLIERYTVAAISV